MKTDAYTAFLRGTKDKIKAFGTTRDSKSFEIPKKLIRQVTPFLLVSAMTLFVMSRDNAEARTLNRENTNSFTEVVSEYHLTELQEKETFSREEILQMMDNPNPPELKDKNFNHMPENQENFWEIVLNGISLTNSFQNKMQLSNKVKQEYKITAFKMLSQIQRVKGTKNEVDLKDYRNLQTFLYFEKVLRFKADYLTVLQQSSGVIDERNEAFGRYYQDQEVVSRVVNDNAGISKFAKALYTSNDKFMLTCNDSIQANQISREILGDWLKAQKLEDQVLWRFVDVKESDYPNTLALFRLRGSRVHAVLDIDPTGKIDVGGTLYSPVGSMIIHEMEHVMQSRPASSEKPEDNQKKAEDIHTVMYNYDDYAGELGPTLHSLAIEDLIYKRIHRIEKNKVVDYGMLDMGSHKVNIGEVAVWFNQMLEKYPHLSIDKVMSEKEVVNQLMQWGNGTNRQMQNTQSAR